MAVDGVGRLEWAEKILVWKTRLGVSFHVLPQSLASRVAGDTRESVSRPQLSCRLCLPHSTFTATTRRFPLPANLSDHSHPSRLSSSSRPTNRADMCIGDAYGAAHVVDGEDSHRVVALLRRASRARRM